MVNQKRRKKTRTSSFGSSVRESHDASSFYKGKLYQDQQIESPSQQKENSFPSKHENYIFSTSSEKMKEIPDNCIHLVTTSPPA